MRGSRTALVSAVALGAIAAAGIAPSSAAAGTISLPTPNPCCSYLLGYEDRVWTPDPLLPAVELQQFNRVTATLSADRRIATIVDPDRPMLPSGDDDAVNVLRQCSLALGKATCKVVGPRPFDGLTISVGNRADSVVLTGATPGRVFGGAGADELTGSSANNSLSGGRHNDRLIGGAGNDYLDDPPPYPQSWSPTTHGFDFLDPGPGEDRVGATEDGDRVLARDGESDFIACHGSAAVVIADPIDRFRDCPNADIG